MEITGTALLFWIRNTFCFTQPELSNGSVSLLFVVCKQTPAPRLTVPGTSSLLLLCYQSVCRKLRAAWAQCCQTFCSHAAPKYISIAGLFLVANVGETLVFTLLKTSALQSRALHKGKNLFREFFVIKVHPGQKQHIMLLKHLQLFASICTNSMGS